MPRPFLAFAAMFWLGTLSPIAGAQAQGTPDAGSAEVEKRIERLEEQIVDMNAHLGTIETMSQSGGGAAVPPSAAVGGGSFGGGSDDARLNEIETQMRALSSQLGEILQRLNQLEQRSGAVSPSQQPAGGSRYGNASQDAEPAEQGTGFSVGGNEPPQSGFGTTVEPGRAANDGASSNGGLSGYFNSSPQNAAPADAAPSAAPNTALGSAPVQTAGRSSPEAQSLYKKAYDALVQRDYRGAVDDFGQFVQHFPTDPLAGPAYYWLGEAAFTNGQYKQAADSFLKSSTNYPQNEKAAEALLKLGISLRRLGETQAACSSFAELSRRFPSATPILQRAEREKSRAQC